MCRYCDSEIDKPQKAILNSLECVIQIDKSTPISRRLNSATMSIALFNTNLELNKIVSTPIRFCPMCGRKLIIKQK